MSKIPLFVEDLEFGGAFCDDCSCVNEGDASCLVFGGGLEVEDGNFLRSRYCHEAERVARSMREENGRLSALVERAEVLAVAAWKIEANLASRLGARMDGPPTMVDVGTPRLQELFNALHAYRKPSGK
jgi:hypothetical protein